MLSDVARRFTEVALDPRESEGDLRREMQALFDAVRESSAADAAAALTIVARGIEADANEKAVLVALCCGALAERGVPSLGMAEPMLRRLSPILPAARRFMDACEDALPSGVDSDGEDFERMQEKLAPSMPQEQAACELLNKLYMPAVALFSTSPEARRMATGLKADLDALIPHVDGAHWLAMILKVMHQEPYLAIEPATKIGIAGHMSGVAENFQLNVLLMDIFPDRSSRGDRRVSSEAAEVARGNGPQQTDETVTGHWNLYTWQALRPDGTLPDPNDRQSSIHWIWNEGVPTDIPTFDGRRIVLLGPPTYERIWGSQRAFANMPAELTVEQELSTAEVHDWLYRLASANNG